MPVGTLLLLLSSQGQAAPQDEGQWSTEFEIPITLNEPILNPQGRVVSFGTTDISIWNPELGTDADSRIKFTPDNPLGFLAFGNVGLLPNTGNILIVGPETTNDAAIFNTQTNRRDNIASVDMNYSRPEFITLANGNIFVDGESWEIKGNVTDKFLAYSNTLEASRGGKLYASTETAVKMVSVDEIKLDLNEFEDIAAFFQGCKASSTKFTATVAIADDCDEGSLEYVYTGCLMQGEPEFSFFEKKITGFEFGYEKRTAV